MHTSYQHENWPVLPTRQKEAEGCRNIIVGVSMEEDPILLRYAALQAHSASAKIYLVHVITLSEPMSSSNTRVLPVSPQEAQRHLDYIALRLQWQGVLCEPIVLFGDPATELSRYAASRRADRILVGAAPSGSGSRLVEDLISATETPVFVVGPRIHLFPMGAPGHGRVLLPLSLRTQPRANLELACELAAENRSRLALLHVLDLAGVGQMRRERTFADANARLAALAAALPHPCFPVETIVREGAVATTIVEEAFCPHGDFIVLRTSPSASAPPGEIVRQVIAEARCPVVAVQASALRPPQAVRESSKLGTGTYPSQPIRLHIRSVK